MDNKRIVDAMIGYSSKTIYGIACMMIEEEQNNKIEFISSEVDIEKVKGILDYIKDRDIRRMTFNQKYCLKYFIASEMHSYFDVKKEDDVIQAQIGFEKLIKKYLNDRNK